MAKDIVKKFRIGSEEAAILKEKAEKAGIDRKSVV